MNINYNYDHEENDYEVTPDTDKNGGKNKTIDNDKIIIIKKTLRIKQIMKT